MTIAENSSNMKTSKHIFCSKYPLTNFRCSFCQSCRGMNHPANEILDGVYFNQCLYCRAC